jgi:hypothetical protein
MRLQKMLLFAVVLSQSGCASPEGAPFPENIRFESPQHFVFVAKGTWIYPANTTPGEDARLSWLTDYLSRSKACPSRYQITQRKPEHQPLSPKASAEDQELRSIT